MAAAVLLVVPASGLASRTFVYRAGFLTYATVRGTHGFRVTFGESNRRRLKVKVTGGRTTTFYTAREASASPGHIEGSLGTRGSFDLHFVPVGKPRPVPIVDWCKGPKASWQRGYLVGRFRFRGERDYTEVRGHRLPAAIESWSRLHCHYAEVEPASSWPRASVAAHSQRASFVAEVFRPHARPPGRRVAFTAWAEQRAGRVSIYRETRVHAAESRVAFPGGASLPEEIEVDPPAPFTGSATFTRTPESTFTWTGDLAVDFPGIAPLRLSGPRFSVIMCALEGCIHQQPERDGRQISFVRPGRPG